jgi:hypothetical protein
VAFTFESDDVRTAWEINRGGRTTVKLDSPIIGKNADGHWYAWGGTISDGASFPWWLRYVPAFIALFFAAFTESFFGAFVLACILQTFVGAAFNRSYLRAAVLHDEAYRNQLRPRSRADWMFYEAMRADGTSMVRALVMWAGVRLGGWYPWRQHKRAADGRV